MDMFIIVGNNNCIVEGAGYFTSEDEVKAECEVLNALENQFKYISLCEHQKPLGDVQLSKLLATTANGLAILFPALSTFNTSYKIFLYIKKNGLFTWNEDKTDKENQETFRAIVEKLYHGEFKF